MTRGAFCWKYIFTSLFLVDLGTCNKFDPHVFPRRGPFFEGWYMRLFDFDTADSIGFLFGHVLPEDIERTNDSKVFSSVLIRTNCSLVGCKLKSYDASFRVSELSVTKHGRPVTTDPDDISPSGFEWRMSSLSARGSFVNRKTNATIDVKFGNVSFYAEIGSPMPWGPNGEGPEGLIDDIPFLPLYWFVYSLRSPIKYYEFKDRKLGIIKRGSRGTVHMEKNWGDSFPKAWIWSEGILANTNISYAITGGPVKIGPLPTVTAFLFGYRNPTKKINLNFRPPDYVTAQSRDGCHGYVNITVKSIFHEVYLYLSANIVTFSDCLYGPERSGFRKACVESYDATADIRVYERQLTGLTLIDKQSIPFSALEFGGEFVCDQKCS